MASLVCDPYAW